MKVETAEREFRYNGVKLKDPNPTDSLEKVREFYSAIYPEIISAAIEGPENVGNKLVYDFRKAVGTKGSSDPWHQKIKDFLAQAESRPVVFGEIFTLCVPDANGRAPWRAEITRIRAALIGCGWYRCGNGHAPPRVFWKKGVAQPFQLPPIFADQPVVVYGPQRSGKSRNVAVFARLFRRPQIVDDWCGTEPLAPDTIATTNLDTAEINSLVPGCFLINVNDARMYARRRGMI